MAQGLPRKNVDKQRERESLGQAPSRNVRASWGETPRSALHPSDPLGREPSSLSLQTLSLHPQTGGLCLTPQVCVRVFIFSASGLQLDEWPGDVKMSRPFPARGSCSPLACPVLEYGGQPGGHRSVGRRKLISLLTAPSGEASLQSDSEPLKDFRGQNVCGRRTGHKSPPVSPRAAFHGPLT